MIHQGPINQLRKSRSRLVFAPAALRGRPSSRPRPGGVLPKVTPLAPERYKVQFTVSRETHDRLREAQDLLRHRIPDGDVAAIFDRALTLLLMDLRKNRHADTDRPRAQRSNRPRGTVCSCGRQTGGLET